MSGERVDAAECRRMRDARDRGVGLRVIAEHVDRPRSVVIHHVRARCGHHDQPIGHDDGGRVGLAGELLDADPDELLGDP